MGYYALHQTDFDDVDVHGRPVASSSSAPLSLNIGDDIHTRCREGSASTATTSPTSALNAILNSIASRTTNTASYDIVEDDDYEDVVSPSCLKKEASSPLFHSPTTVSVPRTRPRLNLQATGTPADQETKNARRKHSSPPTFTPEPARRTASGRSIALRHPTPDLQVLQGAYTGNIEHLEEMAERLSMTSSIDVAIREMHMEQKRNDSRKSSLLSSPTTMDMPDVTRQISNASSILDTNNLARAGGYSPAGFMMSPKGSVTKNGSGRSASKSSRYSSRPEPELEGRPLDSFVNTTRSQTDSIIEQDEKSATLTKPDIDLLDGDTDTQDAALGMDGKPDRPKSPAPSTTTLEQSQMAFADFDGVHSEYPLLSNPEEDSNDFPGAQRRRASSGDRLSMADGEASTQRHSQRRGSQDRLSMAGGGLNNQPRSSSRDRLTMMERPKTYADPESGQQMVYYPAPVPMMLNLPQKLSKLPSSMARNKRRTQVLSTLPPAARGSAMWLPDVLEADQEPAVPEDDGAQQMEYVAQHQRATMGGRRLPTDIQHLPPQLRASAFFDLPGPDEIVEVKEQSAVATLDSILDASARAPVSAFTDHAFAGRLGAEVYGKPKDRRSKSSTHLLADNGAKKRTSSFNLLIGRRSTSQLLESDEQRRNTIDGDSPIGYQGDEHDKDEGSQEGDDSEEEADQLYSGAPTTLLAELQLRKQEQKNRTRPVASQYPNGLHSTLLQLDAVAQVEKKTRNKKRVNLAWEDPAAQDPEDEQDEEEDVPLAILYPNKSRMQLPNRPMGLMERRDMEDNEPLSKRRDRLLGRPIQAPRASTMMNLPGPAATDDEEETLAQRVRRMKGEEEPESSLPKPRPVSGAFSAELLSQFGDLKDRETTATPALEEEETLGQRRKRLQAEKEAREKQIGTSTDATEERPPLSKRRSMADLLQAHPTAGATTRLASYSKPATGLLGLQEKANAQRASTMLNLDREHRQGPKAFAGRHVPMPNNPMGGPVQNQNMSQQRNMPGNFNMYNQPMFPQPSMGYNFGNPMIQPQYANPYAIPYPNGMQMSYQMPNMAMQAPNQMGMGMMGADFQALNPGQKDMVERWRQSVMH